MATIYLGSGITFLHYGDKYSNGDTVFCDDAVEVESIDGIMTVGNPNMAEYIGEELCNTMVAYLIPENYKGVIVGLERAVKEFCVNQII